MTVADYISEIRAQLRAERWATRGTFDLLESALSEYPRAPSLWCLRGDMIQLADEDVELSLDDVVLSHQRALELDPKCGEAYEELGYFHDKVLDDPAAAEPYFRKAIELGRGESAAAGLDAVLDQLRKG